MQNAEGSYFVSRRHSPELRRCLTVARDIQAFANGFGTPLVHAAQLLCDIACELRVRGDSTSALPILKVGTVDSHQRLRISLPECLLGPFVDFVELRGDVIPQH